MPYRCLTGARCPHACGWLPHGICQGWPVLLPPAFPARFQLLSISRQSSCNRHRSGCACCSGTPAVLRPSSQHTSSWTGFPVPFPLVCQPERNPWGELPSWERNRCISFRGPMHPLPNQVTFPSRKHRYACSGTAGSGPIPHHPRRDLT